MGDNSGIWDIFTYQIFKALRNRFQWPEQHSKVKLRSTLNQHKCVHLFQLCFIHTYASYTNKNNTILTLTIIYYANSTISSTVQLFAAIQPHSLF